MSDFRKAGAVKARFKGIDKRINEIERLLREERAKLLEEMTALKNLRAIFQEAYELEDMSKLDNLAESFEEKKKAFASKWGMEYDTWLED